MAARRKGRNATQVQVRAGFARAVRRRGLSRRFWARSGRGACAPMGSSMTPTKRSSPRHRRSPGSWASPGVFVSVKAVCSPQRSLAAP